MKELSIEEKAKRYDEAINRMKHYVVDEYGCSRIKVADVFPGLKESEDERIRKWLIKEMGRRLSCWTSTEVTKEQVLAWLEKQGEQKSNPVLDIEIPFGAKDSELQEASYYIPEGFHAEIEGNRVVIKRGEQKSTWSEEDEMHIRELERLVKQVWAIAEHENNKDTIHKMSDLSFFLKTLKPQLKQDEQKPVVDTKVIIPKFRVGDIVKSKSQPMLSPRKIISIGKDCYWCEDRGCIGFAWEDDCELVEHNPAWSEEDETALGDALWCCKQAASIAKNENDMGNVWYAETWLKSLKDRVQPKQEWSEEDVAMLDSAIAFVEHSPFSTIGKGKNNVIAWLKNLKDKVLTQIK